MDCVNIIVAIPEQQHSYELVSSLRRSGFNVEYITTVYFKKHSKLLKAMKLILPTSTYERAKKHHCEGIEDENVTVFFPLLALVQLSAQRISTQIYRKIRKVKWYLFERKLVSYIKKRKVDILVLYEDYATYVIKHLQGSDTKIIIDCCAASKKFMKDVYEADSNGKLIDKFKVEYPVLWTADANQNIFVNADKLMVPSSVSKKSYECLGIPSTNISIIGYPLNTTNINPKRRLINKGKLKIAYSGQVSFRKGIHHLLKAFVEVSSCFDTELFLYGPYDNFDLYEQYKSYNNIHFKGWTQKDKMLSEMSEMDIFVFPSLSDSMSFSCLEAMAEGIVVICTSNTGASDYIHSYENGIIIEPSSTKSIVDALMWCNENRNELPLLGAKAAETVLKYTDYTVYDENVRKLIQAL